MTGMHAISRTETAIRIVVDPANVFEPLGDLQQKTV
jgi:hypothetical protein